MRWYSRYLTPSLNSYSSGQLEKSCCIRLRWYRLFSSFWVTRTQTYARLSMLSWTTCRFTTRGGSRKLRQSGSKCITRFICRLWKNSIKNTPCRWRNRTCTTCTSTTSKLRDRCSPSTTRRAHRCMTTRRSLTRTTSWTTCTQRGWQNAFGRTTELKDTNAFNEFSSLNFETG